MNITTIVQDVELFLADIKAIVPDSLLANTLLGPKLAEVETVLSVIASIVSALQSLEPKPAPTAAIEAPSS